MFLGHTARTGPVSDPSQEPSFLAPLRAEVISARTFAENKHHVTGLSEEALRQMIIEVGVMMLPRTVQMVEARHAVLAKHIPQRKKVHSLRRKAYSSAIGKFFSERWKYAREHKIQPKPAPPKKEIPSVVDSKTGQYGFLV
jgi:hypothetical protein